MKDDDFNFDFDSDSDFEFVIGNGNEHPTSKDIEMISKLYEENKSEFDELYKKIVRRFKNSDKMLNPIVIKYISELKSYFENECEIESEFIKVNYNEVFNSLGFDVYVQYWGTQGPEDKRKFDSHFLHAQNFEIVHLNNGYTKIGFEFENAYIFLNSKDDSK